MAVYRRNPTPGDYQPDAEYCEAEFERWRLSGHAG